MSAHRQSAALPLSSSTARSATRADELSSQSATLARLAQEVQQLEAAGRKPTGLTAISTGCLAMDACLPAGGYVPGTVIEYLRSTSGCGATYLAFTAAAAALRASEDKYLVIVDTNHQLYPPALLCHQISLQRVIWVRPLSQADAVWATDQALRTTAVAAVVADLDVLDERDARRLQLAVERGGGVGLLLRNLSARRMPSWAEVQWVVRSLLPTAKMSRSGGKSFNAASLQAESLQAATLQAESLQAGSLQAEPTAVEPLRRLEVGLARVRGGKAGAQLLLDIDGVRGTLTLAARDRNSHDRITAPERTSTQRTSTQRNNTERTSTERTNSQSQKLHSA